MRFPTATRIPAAIWHRTFHLAACALPAAGFVLAALTACFAQPGYGAPLQPRGHTHATVSSVQLLLAEARRAYALHRIIAPAGRNAVHYYSEVLSQDPHNRLAADALREIFPYAVPVVRRTIADRHTAEAKREIALLARAEPDNYTLTLLRADLAQQHSGPDSSAAARSARVHTLTIRASGTCWIEIRRLDNKIIDARLLRTGDVRTYRSAVPLRVTLGYANAVTVTADGKRVHLAPATPGNSEHLVLFGAGGPQLRIGHAPLQRDRSARTLAPAHHDDLGSHESGSRGR